MSNVSVIKRKTCWFTTGVIFTLLFISYMIKCEVFSEKLQHEQSIDHKCVQTLTKIHTFFSCSTQ